MRATVTFNTDLVQTEVDDPSGRRGAHAVEGRGFAIDGAGGRPGGAPVFQALATLAWDPRRAEFFRGEIFVALSIVANGDITVAGTTGSWAGTMGQSQFLPSSYLQLAVDADGDGRRDIWASTADALGSIANYLRSYGWQREFTWGRAVWGPDDLAGTIPGRAIIARLHEEHHSGRGALHNLRDWEARLSPAGDPTTMDAVVAPAGGEEQWRGGFRCRWSR